MGVTKVVEREGNQTQNPRPGNTVVVNYTGYIYDETRPGNKGRVFDTSATRGPFTTVIGSGSVIRGWDEGLQMMSLGEKATLIITSDYGYAERGFPGSIPPNSDLVFDVELTSITP